MAPARGPIQQSRTGKGRQLALKGPLADTRVPLQLAEIVSLAWVGEQPRENLKTGPAEEDLAQARLNRTHYGLERTLNGFDNQPRLISFPS